MNKEKRVEQIEECIKTHCFLAKELFECKDLIVIVEAVANEIAESYRNNGKLFLCGNGGSAADAQHLAAELVGRFYKERKALSAEALTTNTSVITALANDYDYNMVFARQLEAKGGIGDVFIGITTSGTSRNVLLAIEQAKKQGMKTVMMTGKYEKEKYEKFIHLVDYLIAVPSADTPRIQECHILLGHIICEIVEKELFS